jgi:lysylphosphatidylglycerol synthetase-like protein (DUF2156 family)
MKMSAEMREWAVVLVFFLFAFGLTFVEAIWLSRKNWTSFGKALAFAVTTNVVGFVAGFAVLFVMSLAIFMLVFEGVNNDSRLAEWGIWAALIFGILFFPLFLAFCKVILLKVLKIQTGKAAWIFSFVISFLLVVLSFVIPILVGGFLFR